VAKSRQPASDRLAIGQLLVRLLREFRDDLAAPRADAGYGDIREPHFQIFGNIRMGGIRLTELADRAQLSLAAASELVNDLAEMGYLTRRPDPSDGRAKLIDLTKRGGELMADAGHRAPVVRAGRREELRPDVPDDAAAARRARPDGGAQLARRRQSQQ
jgi:DNA-binding MarR family transcriptional regulator